jgi:hypothetical protein
VVVIDLIKQYQRNPNYPYRRPYPQQIKSQRGSNKKFIYILAVIAVIAMVALVFVLAQPSPSVNPVCGNGKCESNENCFDCPLDCKCQANEYCSEESKQCIKPVCGNSKCETFESNLNCCEDCPCYGALETCNKNTHKCEIPTISISDQRVKELVTQYYTNNGKTIKEFGEITDKVYENKPIKIVRVIIEGEEQITHVAGVTESEKVIEIPFY